VFPYKIFTYYYSPTLMNQHQLRITIVINYYSTSRARTRKNKFFLSMKNCMCCHSIGIPDYLELWSSFGVFGNHATRWSSGMIFPHLWGRFYVRSVTRQNGRCGSHRQSFHHPSPHITSGLIIHIPFTSSGGYLRVEASSNSTLMDPNLQQAQRQGLFSAIGKEDSSWLVLDLWRMLQL